MSEVKENLKHFVTYFVKEFETKLQFFHKILEHEAKKSGKFANYSGKVGEGVGASVFGGLGLLLGLPVGVTANAGRTAGQNAAEWLGSKIGSEKYLERVTNLSDLIDSSQNDKTDFRLELVKAGVDIFQSFEMQFMRVITKQSKKDALHYLAIDAVNRSINYRISNIRAPISKSAIFGESKKNEIYSTSPGFSIIYQDSDTKLEWNTASLFTKSGIVTEDESLKYFALKDGSSSTSKYGYRRLLQEENWDLVELKYELDSSLQSSQFKGYKYEVKRDNLEEVNKDILSEINNKDNALSENRVCALIQEVKDDLLNEITDLKVLLKDEHEGNRELLLNLEESLRALKVEEYVKVLVPYLEEAKEERSLISASIEKGRKENEENFENVVNTLTDISNDNKENHEETVDLMQTFKDVAFGLSNQMSNLCIKQDVVKEPVWFNMQAPVWSFTGRETELLFIHEALQSSQYGQAVISQSTSITGLGGIGKSELARKYAFDYKEYYSDFVWIDAETTASLQKSFQELSNELQLQTIITKCTEDQERPIRDIVKNVFQYFGNGKTLFIFDNAEECKSVSEFLPNFSQLSQKGLYFLITSRNRNWEFGQEGEIAVVALDQFSPKEAFDFVKKFLSIKEDSQDEIIKTLSETLQYFPLALKQAVSYIKQQNKCCKLTGSAEFTIDHYLKEIEEQPASVLNKGHYDDLDRYTYTLTKTWEITLKKIVQDSDFGELPMHYFNLISYFGPDNIPIKSYFSKAISENKQWEAVILLHKYSMINLDKGVINVHRLVQQVSRIKLINEGKEESVLADILKIIKNTNDSMHIVSVWNRAASYNNLIEKFYEESFYGEEKSTALHHLAANDKVTAIESVLKCIGLENIECKNEHGSTPLFSAVANGHIKTVKLLVDLGANLNVEKSMFLNIIKWTPLAEATLKGYKEIVTLLLEKGVDEGVLRFCDSQTQQPIYNVGAEGLLKTMDIFHIIFGVPPPYREILDRL